jgi:D-threonine aldolase
MDADDNWYIVENAAEVDSPALIVFPVRVKKNIEYVVEKIGDVKRLRPHVKTHKTKEVTLLLMEIGVNKFKCATIAEGELLGMCGAKDALIAYPVNGPKVERLVALIQKYPNTQFSCLIDNEKSAKRISESAINNGLEVNVFIDLNVGMNRTGIKVGKMVNRLYESVQKLPGLKLRGLHAYDGHIRDIELSTRNEKAAACFSEVQNIVRELSQMGYSTPELILGGSPTFPFYSSFTDVECSPGTFVFWDQGYQDTLPEQLLLSAALVISRIVSLPDERKICIDLGYKAVASENPLDRRVYFLNAPELTIVSHSEEHMVLEAKEEHSWKVGDMLYGVPYHICPTCALYEQMMTVTNGMVNGYWKVLGRNRSIFC